MSVRWNLGSGVHFMINDSMAGVGRGVGRGC